MFATRIVPDKGRAAGEVFVMLAPDRMEPLVRLLRIP